LVLGGLAHARRLGLPIQALEKGAVSGRQRRHGRKPAVSAAAADGKNETLADRAGRSGQTGRQCDHIELDRRFVPEVLDRARRGEIGKPELIVAQHSNRALRRQVRLAIRGNGRCVAELDLGDGGAAYINVSIARSGVIKKAGTIERLAFGEFDNKVSKRAQAFLDACKAGDINADIPSDISLENCRGL
jgi:hypothetical protein